MKRTTIFVPEPLERDLQLYARQEQRPVASVVREAIVEYLAARRSGPDLPSFVGIAESGRRDIAERHEDLLWADPHGGSDRRPAPSPKRAGLKRSRKRR